MNASFRNQHATIVLTSFFAIVVATTCLGQSVSVTKMALITCKGEIEVNAAPAQVWAALTEPSKARSWCPYWKSANTTDALDAVGRTIAYVDGWGNKGKSVVIYAEKGKELRVAHVPDDGSYVCQGKFVLKADGGRTIVAVTEEYSDQFDVPTDKDTALQTKGEIENYLSDLKIVAEKRLTTK